MAVALAWFLVCSSVTAFVSFVFIMSWFSQYFFVPFLPLSFSPPPCFNISYQIDKIVTWILRSLRYCSWRVHAWLREMELGSLGACGCRLSLQCKRYQFYWNKRRAMFLVWGCLRGSPSMCGGVSSAAQWFGGTTAMWTLTYKLKIWTISSCSTVCCSSGFNVRRNNPEHLW